MSPSPEIEKCKDKHPYQIYEVPVETQDLDDLVIALSAGKEAASPAVEISPPNFSGDDDQEDHSDRHVRAVKARDHEKARAKLHRAPRIAPGSNSFPDQLGPLESLHSDEGCAKCCGRQHESRGFDAIAAVAEVDRHSHRPAAAN